MVSIVLGVNDLERTLSIVLGVNDLERTLKLRFHKCVTAVEHPAYGKDHSM